MQKNIIIFFFIGFLFSCSQGDPELDEVLSISGENRGELEKVLKHYKANTGDSLKYQAARHLIIQMTQFKGVSLYSKRYDDFSDLVFDSLLHTGESMFVSKNPVINKFIRTKIFEDIWDYYAELYGPPSSYNFTHRTDLHHISADFLIENIEYAFKAWDLPWSRKYSFEEFCDHILPYRYAYESLAPWRRDYWEYFGPLIDSLGNEQDPVKAAVAINESLKRYFWGSEKMIGIGGGHPRPRDLIKGMIVGNCEDQVGLGFSAMRALGIATTEIMVPNWGFGGIHGHSFNAILSPDTHQWIDFHGGDINPGDNNTNHMPKAFSYKSVRKGDPENYLALLHGLKDVTHTLTKVKDIHLDLNGEAALQKYVYLSVFNGSGWQPVMWGKVKNNQVLFKDMGAQMAYLPVYINEGHIIPFSDPIILDSLGNITNCIPQGTKTRKARLLRKYKIKPAAIEARCNDMMGGTFQVARSEDFSDAETLYRISECSSYLPNEVAVKPKTGRYVRYIFPSVERLFKDGPSWITFFSGKGNSHQKLKGPYLSSEPILERHLEAIFDDDLLTYVGLLPSEVSTPQDLWDQIPFQGHVDSLWVGMDLGTELEISKIGFCPRNDKNNIYPRLLYELYYWDGEWVSLGAKVADSHEITFNNIPSGALYLLRCHSEGKEERIFTLNEHGEQVWW